MTLLEDIQQSAIDGKSDLAELLRKCKLLAARLGSKPLENWLVWESNGYSKNADIPDYRVWSVEILGNFEGPFGSNIKNAPIPISLLTFIPQEIKDLYRRWECTGSIANIEDLLQQSATGPISINTGTLAVIIGTKLYQDQQYNCVQTWGEFSRGRLIEVVNSVRNRILDFALAIEKEFPHAGESKDTAQQIPESTITHIFNTTVYGGAANIMGTAHKSPVTINIGQRDFACLEAYLREQGIEETDIADLKNAMEQDQEPTRAGTFGEKVASWIGRMVTKAATGGWQIGAGAAGDLLAKAISQYYGF